MAAAMVEICNAKLKMFNTFSRGCGIKTNVLLKEGNSVISSDPYVVVLRSEFHGEMCDKCLTVKENLSRCSHCKSTYYCGRACQKMAWKIHKLECDYLKKCLTRIPSDTVRLMALFFLRNKEKSEHWVKELTTHCEKIRKEKGKLFSHFLSSLRTFLNHTLDLNNEEIFQQFCKINCNTFTISNGEMKPVGLGLYPTTSFINHSCHPNCVAIFTGPTCHIQTIRDIQSGEEICISYTELLRPCHMRRGELKKQYFFDCLCVGCKKEESSGTVMNGLNCANKDCSNAVGFQPEVSQNNMCGACGTKVHYSYNSDVVTDLYQTIEVKLSSINELVGQRDGSSKALSICECLLNDADKILHPLNYQVLKIIDKISDLCIEMSLWNKALYYCKKALLSYQKFYPKYHPSIGLQLYRIGKLELYLDMFDSALRSLSQAKHVLDICYGEKHPTSMQLDQLMFQTIQEKQILSIV